MDFAILLRPEFFTSSGTYYPQKYREVTPMLLTALWASDVPHRSTPAGATYVDGRKISVGKSKFAKPMLHQ